MKTKTQLLNTMKRLNACPEATAYVSGHKSRSANRIVQDCTEPNWLVWFLIRQKVDLSAFAFGCADRACRIYAPAVLEKAGKVEEAAKLMALPKIVDKETALRTRDAARTARTARTAYYAAYYAANYDAVDYSAAYYAASASAAAYAARSAAARSSANSSASANYASASAEECKIQLSELKVLGKEWACS